MLFPLRCGRLPAAFLVTTLLGMWSFAAHAGAAMMADGEPGKGFNPPPSKSPDAVIAPGPFSLSTPMRLDVTPLVHSAIAADNSWCTYRITAYTGPNRRGVVTPGDEICMSNRDLFGVSPDVAEFHFLDRTGRELASAYGERVSATCGSCVAEPGLRFAIYRR